MSVLVRSASRSASALNPRRTFPTCRPSPGPPSAVSLSLHVLEQFAEQPGRFGLEGRGGAQPYPGLLRRAGEAGVQLADQAGDVAGGLVGEVGVAAEMVGDDLRGVLGADPGRLEEQLGREAEPFDDPPEVRQVGQVAFLDPREGVERDVALGGRGAQAEAEFLAVLADAHLQGVDVDGFIHVLPPSGACPVVGGTVAREPGCVTGLVSRVPQCGCTSIGTCCMFLEQLDRNPAPGLPSTPPLMCISPSQESRGAMPMTGHAGSPSAGELAVMDAAYPRDRRYPRAARCRLLQPLGLDRASQPG